MDSMSMKGGPALQEVTLAEMLDAREARAAAQAELQARYPEATLISFTLNIPGPVKNTPAVERAFFWGCRRIESLLHKRQLLCKEEKRAVTGCEALYAVRRKPRSLKKACVALEDENDLGRLFDIDIIAPDGRKLDRADVGQPERGCMVCGAPGRGCASRRLHSVAELQAAAFGRIERHFRDHDAEIIRSIAVRALCDEVNATPKPGLVDRNNSGSHDDMDIDTFHRSAAALSDYFRECAAIGMAHRDLPPPQVFQLLRTAGLTAERAMYAATDGVNTHKGAIYTLGVLCGAAGYLRTVEQPAASADALLDMAADLTKQAAEADFAYIREKNAPKTAGERLYLEYGLTGIRGEVARGLPSIREYGLPAWQHARQHHLDPERTGIYALLHLIAHTDDTTLWHRGGKEGADYARRTAAMLLRHTTFPTTAQLEALDRDFTARRLSPGGSADLLAVLYFLDYMSTWAEAFDVKP